MSAVAPAAPWVLTISCPDRRGIVAAVSGLLFAHGCNIVDSAQFGDVAAGRFFMRVVFHSEDGSTIEGLRAAFATIAARFDMTWEIFDSAVKTRMIVMVSKFGHCLNDLLYRYDIGALPVEIPAIISNHAAMAPLAAARGIPFHLLPVTRDNRAEQEARLLALVEELDCDLIVLARYMQILSDRLCGALPGRIINIHHSFLPSFKGAKPYHQAHARGVKLIGATAHYVTPDLDEGPIIEQETMRVHHGMSAEDFVAAGRDIESLVLSRAVLWHAEHRILPNGGGTVVFR